MTSRLCGYSIYDLREDPWEQDDLSGARPKVFDELLADWEAYREANGVLTGDDP